DNGPDYSGSCQIDGVDYFFDSWLKTADSGRKWMSFSFKKKDKQGAGAPQRNERPNVQQRTSNRPGSAASYGSAGPDDDRDIPF
ncbi:hypothetical protein, partial [Roseateles sp. P5_E11]